MQEPHLLQRLKKVQLLYPRGVDRGQEGLLLQDAQDGLRANQDSQENSQSWVGVLRVL